MSLNIVQYVTQVSHWTPITADQLLTYNTGSCNPNTIHLLSPSISHHHPPPITIHLLERAGARETETERDTETSERESERQRERDREKRLCSLSAWRAAWCKAGHQLDIMLSPSAARHTLHTYRPICKWTHSTHSHTYLCMGMHGYTQTHSECSNMLNHVARCDKAVLHQ